LYYVSALSDKAKKMFKITTISFVLANRWSTLDVLKRCRQCTFCAQNVHWWHQGV